MVTHGPITTEPTCPRCGYDQSGEVAAWTDRCPTEGLCPECGTRFFWADLFDPARQNIRWLVEHAETFRGRAQRTVPTLWRMVRPWVFWRRVDVLARTNPRAVASWVLLLWAAAHLITWIPFSILFAMMEYGYGFSFGGVRDFFQDATLFTLMDAALTGFCWPVVSFVDLWPSWKDNFAGREVALLFRVPLGMGLAWALVMSVLPATRRLAKLRHAHVVRALLFQWGMVVLAYYAIRSLLPSLHDSGNRSVELAVVGIYGVVCIWSLAWWAIALRVGWGVRSWTLMILGTFAAVLGGVVLVTIEDSVGYIITRF